MAKRAFRLFSPLPPARPPLDRSPLPGVKFIGRACPPRFGDYLRPSNRQPATDYWPLSLLFGRHGEAWSEEV